MFALALLGFSSLAISFAVTPLLRDLFVVLGVVDRPDGKRKLHVRPVPRIGGISIAIAYLAAFGLLLCVPAPGRDEAREQISRLVPLLPATALIFAIGLYDDLRGVLPWQKLAVQVCAAGWVAALGVRIHSIAGYSIGATLGIALTILWLVWCSNAFNLIDGLDGLASGLGLFALLILAAGSLSQNEPSLALVTVPLAGALIGFLRYNFNPASVFLGDCGSLLVGFLLGACGVMWTQKSVTVLGISAPILTMAVPSLDVALSIARRFLRRRPIFSADRGHIHHRLLDSGLTPRRAAVALYGLGGIYASVSLASSVFQHKYGGLVLVITCVVTWVGVQSLDYREFAEMLWVFRSGSVQELVNARLRLWPLREVIGQATSARACCRAALAVSREAGVRKMDLHLGGERYTIATAPAPAGPEWQMHFPLGSEGGVTLTGSPETLQPLLLLAFVDALRRDLPAQLEALSGPAESGAVVHEARNGALEQNLFTAAEG